MVRRLVLLLAAFTALALTSLAGLASAASTGVGAQNRVWALQTGERSLVGENGSESSCTHPGLSSGSAGIASGFCVAAEEPAAEGVLKLSPDESFGNMAKLEDHFLRHGADFGATSPEEYASDASEFLQEGVRGDAQVKVDSRGVIRVYDPNRDAIGPYNADGTRTFYKPDPTLHGYPSNQVYFDAQPGTAP